MWTWFFSRLRQQQGSKPAGLTEVEWPRHSQPQPEQSEYPRRRQLRPERPETPQPPEGPQSDQTPQPEQPHSPPQPQVDLTKPHIVRFGDGSYGVRKQVQEDDPKDGWLDYFYNPMSLTFWSPTISVYSRKTLGECKEILIKLAAQEEAKRQQEAREAIVEVLDWSATTVDVAVLSDGSTVRLRS